jgi:ABC-2 type transport system permease protein
VAIEIERRTVTALLVTPARTWDVIAAKSLTGTLLGLGQAFLFLLATRSFGDQWLLVTVLVVLAASMMSAMGLIAGAAGGDFMSTLFNGIVLLIPLMIPAFAILLPGSVSLWVKLLPSHGLLVAMTGAVGYGRGWLDLAPHLASTLLWMVILYVAAVFLLKRRLEVL